MKILLLHFTLILAFCNTGYSQKGKFHPGFYINLKGDTISGFISSNIKNTKPVFNFKSEANAVDFKTISFDTCKLLTEGNESYANWFGPRGMTYIDKFEFTIENPDSIIIARIPLKLLYQGKKISLYIFHDIMDHFFISAGGTIQELSVKYRNVTNFEKIQLMNQKNPPTYFSIPVYKDQIRDLIGNKLSRAKNDLVESTEFDDRSLVKLFKKLDAR